MMSNQTFDIIFRGDIVFGHQLADVKLRLQQLFKADSAKVDALFSGRPVPLKRGLDQASAEKYKEALTRAGAQVDIVPTGETKVVTTAVARSVSRPSEPMTTVVALTLAQRIEQQAAADKEATEQREQVEREQAGRDSAQGIQPSEDGWSLAPVGSYLLQPSEQHVVAPVVVDTSAISLRAAQAGNILDVNEQLPDVIAAVVAPDFGVAEVGADLVRADEKMDLPLLEIELAEWSLADLGEDLISATEKPQVAIPVIHIPDVGLAPAGADLGQLRPIVSAVIPDVSGIRLAD